MDFGMSMETASAGIGDGVALPNPRAKAARSSHNVRYSPRTCVMIWAAASVVSWALVAGVGAGAMELGRIVLG